MKMHQARVPGWMHLSSALVTRFHRLWRRLGDAESWLVRDVIAAHPVVRPVFVAGMARAGTTILLEVLASQPGMVSHRYKDYPFLFTPYAWNWYLKHTPQRAAEPSERFHRDRILVTPDSPEAMEEMIWMSFFPKSHRGDHDVLGPETAHSSFARFFRQHISKLLAVRGGQRYLSKNNYNLTRLGYLQQVFPDARFLIPVRHPFHQVASSVKQHRLFVQALADNPRALAHLGRVGHFEFGPGRRPIHCGDDGAFAATCDDFSAGRDAVGYARAWASLYELALRELRRTDNYGGAAMIVRYEDLCASPGCLERIAAHLGLSAQAMRPWGSRLSSPRYYRPELSAEEAAAVESVTRDVADELGYRAGPRTDT